MHPVQPQIKSQVFEEQPPIGSKVSRYQYDTYDKKELLDIGKIQPYMK